MSREVGDLIKDCPEELQVSWLSDEASRLEMVWKYFPLYYIYREGEREYRV